MLPWDDADIAGGDFYIVSRNAETLAAENSAEVRRLLLSIRTGLLSRPDAFGTLAERSQFDNEPSGFIYHEPDEATGGVVAYYKTGETAADWTTGLSVRGEQGIQGIQGVQGIQGEQGEQGIQGERGEGLAIGQVGNLAGRDVFDSEATGFSYLDDDSGLIYFKQSDATGDWTSGTPFSNSSALVNVTAFGAVGDGVADDTIAIQGAIDELQQNGGGELYFPAGEYLISRQGSEFLATRTAHYCLNITSDNITINLSTNAILKIADEQATDGRITAILVGTPAGDVGNNFSVVGRGVIDANEANQSDPLQEILHSAAILIFGAIKNILLRDITIKNSMGDALFTVGVSNESRMDGVSLENVNIDHCAEGYVWNRTDNVRIIGGRSNTFLQDGYEPTEECDGTLIDGVFVESIGPGNSSIDLFGGKNIKVINSILTGKVNIGTGVTRPTGAMDDVLFANNTVRDGFVQVGGMDFAITNVRILDNKIEGGSGGESGARGITVFHTASNFAPKGIVIQGNFIEEVDGHGINVDPGVEDVDILYNRVVNAGRLNQNGNDYGIRAAGHNQRIIGNRVLEDRATPHQQFGINVWSSTGSLQIISNDIDGFANTGIDYQALSGVTRFVEADNKGHVTKAYGSITVPAGTNQASQPHGLSVTSPPTTQSNTRTTITARNASASQRGAIIVYQGANLTIFLSSNVTSPAEYEYSVERFAP